MAKLVKALPQWNRGRVFKSRYWRNFSSVLFLYFIKLHPLYVPFTLTFRYIHKDTHAHTRDDVLFFGGCTRHPGHHVVPLNRGTCGAIDHVILWLINGHVIPCSQRDAIRALKEASWVYKRLWFGTLGTFAMCASATIGLLKEAQPREVTVPSHFFNVCTCAAYADSCFEPITFKKDNIQSAHSTINWPVSRWGRLFLLFFFLLEHD